MIRGSHQEQDASEKTYESYTTLAWPFPQEVRAGKPDLSAVIDLALLTGGQSEPSASKLFDNEGKTTPKNTPLWPFPLYALMALLLLDLLVRRVRMWGETEIQFRRS